MDLSIITMDRDAARRAFLDYRHAVKDRHTTEDEQIMRGYRALARGQQVLNLRETLRAGGCFDDGTPKLAVAQSDTEWVYLDRHYDGGVRFAPRQYPASRQRKGITRLPADTLPSCRELQHPRDPRGWCAGAHEGWMSGRRAMVPIVPPALRPRHSLAGYITLFEVPEWLTIPRPPGDPALLKYIGGELYAVVAIWDLTPLEQAVLAGRSVS